MVKIEHEKSEVLTKFLDYAHDKEQSKFWKKVVFGIMAGIFVGLGYAVFIVISQSNAYGSPEAIALGWTQPENPEWTKSLLVVLGAAIFPVALFLCMFLGGNLFTSNCLVFMGVLCKKIKWRHMFLDLLIVLVTNAVGCGLIAVLLWGTGMFGGINGNEINAAGLNAFITARHKIDNNHQWYNNILGGIICNLLVSGSVLLFLKNHKKGWTLSVIYLMIVLFAICSFQHVVANMYIFFEAGLVTSMSGPQFSGAEVGKIFYQNIIPSIVGNFLGGSLLLVIYVFALKNKKEVSLS